MKIAVVGGGGYLGSSLVAHWSGRHDVVCAGHERRFSLVALRVGETVRFHPCRLDDPSWVRIVDDADVVVHAAGQSGDQRCVTRPADAAFAHAVAAGQLAEWLERRAGRRVIYCSSMAVYGRPRLSCPLPFREEAAPRPSTYYGLLKRCGEQVLEQLRGATILRLAHVYGFGSGIGHDPEGVTMRFVRSVARGQAPLVRGGGRRWDFVHIADVAAAIDRVLTQGIDGLFNIGGGPTPIDRLAAVVVEEAQALGLTVEPRGDADEDADGGEECWLATTRAEATLSWRAIVPLATGIRELLERQGQITE